MNPRLLPCLLLFCACTQVSAQEKFPDDVAAFVDRRDGCDHFRGEYPYDEDRRLFLLKSMKDLCTGTDGQLAEFRKKYGDQSRIMETLSGYEAQIELSGEK